VELSPSRTSRKPFRKLPNFSFFKSLRTASIILAEVESVGSSALRNEIFVGDIECSTTSQPECIGNKGLLVSTKILSLKEPERLSATVISFDR
jgi:hypothetical protein